MYCNLLHSYGLTVIATKRSVWNLSEFFRLRNEAEVVHLIWV